MPLILRNVNKMVDDTLPGRSIIQFAYHQRGTNARDLGNSITILTHIYPKTRQYHVHINQPPRKSTGYTVPSGTDILQLRQLKNLVTEN